MFNGLVSLEPINLKNNKISKIENNRFSLFDKIESLSISFNIWKLKELSISQNQITTIYNNT